MTLCEHYKIIRSIEINKIPSQIYTFEKKNRKIKISLYLIIVTSCLVRSARSGIVLVNSIACIRGYKSGREREREKRRWFLGKTRAWLEMRYRARGRGIPVTEIHGEKNEQLVGINIGRYVFSPINSRIIHHRPGPTQFRARRL